MPRQRHFLEDELPENQVQFIQINAELCQTWPNITEKKDALPDAAQWDGVEGKLKDLVK